MIIIYCKRISKYFLCKFVYAKTSSPNKFFHPLKKFLLWFVTGMRWRVSWFLLLLPIIISGLICRMYGPSIPRHVCPAISIVFFCFLICCDVKPIEDAGFRPAWESERFSTMDDEPVIVQKYRQLLLDPSLGYSAKKQPDASSSDYPVDKRWQPTGFDLKDAYRKMAMAIVLHRKALRSQNYVEGRRRRFDSGVILPDLRTRLTMKQWGSDRRLIRLDRRLRRCWHYRILKEYSCCSYAILIKLRL